MERRKESFSFSSSGVWAQIRRTLLKIRSFSFFFRKLAKSVFYKPDSFKEKGIMVYYTLKAAENL
jgi:hypothetical protein